MPNITGQTWGLLKNKNKKPELQSICFILMKGWWCYSKWGEYMLDSRRGNLLLLQETMTLYQIARFIIISPRVQQTFTWCCCQFCANDKTVWMLEYMEAYYPQPVAGDISANTFPLWSGSRNSVFTCLRAAGLAILPSNTYMPHHGSPVLSSVSARK